MTGNAQNNQYLAIRRPSIVGALLFPPSVIPITSILHNDIDCTSWIIKWTVLTRFLFLQIHLPPHYYSDWISCTNLFHKQTRAFYNNILLFSTAINRLTLLFQCFHEIESKNRLHFLNKFLVSLVFHRNTRSLSNEYVWTSTDTIVFLSWTQLNGKSPRRSLQLDSIGRSAL